VPSLVNLRIREVNEVLALRGLGGSTGVSGANVTLLDSGVTDAVAIALRDENVRFVKEKQKWTDVN
jgi:hypothetical protein